MQSYILRRAKNKESIVKDKIQLFCIPYAGGTAELFSELGGLFDENIEVIRLEYAGHGSRKKEDYYNDFQEMTDDLAEHINQLINPDAGLALFGYSMGSMVAYELFAQNKLIKKPDYMFFASHEAPDVEWESKSYCKFDDEKFFEMIQKMGGFERCTSDMLGNRFFRKLHFEPVRADYELLGNYKMSKKVLIDVPAILFYSSKDIAEESIKSWESFLIEHGIIREMGDDHFFIKSHASVMAKDMMRVFEYDTD